MGEMFAVAESSKSKLSYRNVNYLMLNDSLKKFVTNLFQNIQFSKYILWNILHKNTKCLRDLYPLTC
uniref:Uncharacterized protein n=1 Tax=Kalanchoe fedtschenkoi TaxID=63787 RepID=A0A7N0UDS2_KALFE